jgi:ribonuclease HI
VETTKLITIWTDGGARSNPGPAGIGAVIAQSTPHEQKHETLFEVSEYIGPTTNNQAEYKALVTALTKLLDYATEHGIDPKHITLQLFTDSELMAYQVQGKYKVKNAELLPLKSEVVSKLALFAGYTITPIRREFNAAADKLVNAAIDAAYVESGH